MAISVDHNTYVITVGKVNGEAGMSLVQSIPTEIWQLDINQFRLALKDWEDSEAAMAEPDTHRHNTEVSLGGLTFARVVEILDPYTVLFEDGQYAINFVGANTNLADLTIVNQVSVRPNNSAGLISTPLIEFASFEGGVWWDPDNITGQADYGTTFPLGTRLKPTRDLSDVRLIAQFRGLNVVYVMGDCTVNSGLDFTRYIFEGQTNVNNKATVTAAAGVMNTVFRHLEVTGTLDGGNELVDCIIDALEYVNGFVQHSGLKGDIELGGGSSAVFRSCYTTDPNNTPVIDMGGSGQDLAMPGYSGVVTIKNLTGSNFVGIGIAEGQVILDSTTISDGVIHVAGSGRLTDENNVDIPSGTWNGATIINTCNAPSTMADAVWDEAIADHLAAGSTGAKLNTASSGGVDYDILASAIWDEPIADHSDVGSTGEALSDASSGGATAEEVRIEMDANSTKLIAIKERTDNLPDNPAEVSDIPTAANIADAVWDEQYSAHLTSGTFGELLSDVLKLTGYKVTKSGDIITIFESDGSTTWRQYNLANGGRVVV
jgi:hypothetical protein